MSITNSRLIRDSLGLIGELAETQDASVEQVELGMRVLNETLADWFKDGIDLQYTPQSIAGATTPIPDDAIAAVKHFLGFALAPYFGATVTPALYAIGEKFYARLIRDAMNDKLRPIKAEQLAYGEGQRIFLNINAL